MLSEPVCDMFTVPVDESPVTPEGDVSFGEVSGVEGNSDGSERQSSDSNCESSGVDVSMIPPDDQQGEQSDMQHEETESSIKLCEFEHVSTPQIKNPSVREPFSYTGIGGIC